ncbi:pyridoxamine 5'-phosphate oxidase family protein [Mesorhizobium sp. IMUNJ 23232]|uniref:pyridoxamine 5'-phosphate oxidase family protein n=1 Tax=Mesorhizobium sp. IMUNJ 23232 TaxID=3376064 RepID=UPI0037AB1407
MTVSGSGGRRTNRAKIRRLWESPDRAWWDSSDDPDIRLTTFTPDEGKLWDSPGKIAAMAKNCYDSHNWCKA